MKTRLAEWLTVFAVSLLLSVALAYLVGGALKALK